MSKERRFTFDEVAELYDKHRPGYPSALFDDLISLARLKPRSRLLEIGCGTGKATLPLAQRGHSLVCLEPGSDLARVATRHLPPDANVEILPATFEDWPLETEAFDLVFSAQAFHWVPPEISFPKAAAALKPGGALAVFGNAVLPTSSPLRDAIDDVYCHHAPSLPGPLATRWYAQGGAVESLFEASGCFGRPRVRRYPRTRRYSASEYSALLETHSDHRTLPPNTRETLLAEVRCAIEAHGGSLEIAYETSLYLAAQAAACT